MEECRSFYMNLISARGLKDVRSVGNMRVYSQVSIRGAFPERVWYTPVDKRGKTYPAWGCGNEVLIPEKVLQEEKGAEVFIVFYCDRTFLKDKYVGEVTLSLKTLFDNRLAVAGKNMECKVHGNDGTGFGTLVLSYGFAKSTENADPKIIDTQNSRRPTKGKLGRVISKFKSAITDGLQFVEGGVEVVEFFSRLLNEEE